MYLQRTDCPKPILVCAPSNAAIDEIVTRTVRDGIMGFNGTRRTDLRMLRVGNQKKDQTELKQRSPSDKSEQHTEVVSISLQHLVSQKLRDQGLQDEHTTLTTLRERLEKIESDLAKTEENEQPSLCARLRQDRKEAITALNREKCSKALFEDKKRTAELELLQTVDIVFTTLSGAASKCLEKLDRRFELVVIDEACQTVELTSLIPLQYKARKVIMIGDPMQLPATTFSEAAAKAGYSRSLFERLACKGIPVITLKDQYRMVPDIREFPSSAFYGGMLTDGNQSRPCPVWRPAPSLLFVDLKTSAEVRDEEGTSVANVHESNFITDLYRHFSRFHGTGMNIGVLTPYRRQVSSIKACLQYKFGSKWLKDVEVNTIDGFQGREKDVIVFSTVRSRDQIGFLSDIRRLNVAVTRAKFALWVVGRAETLQRHKTWAQFLGHCEDRGRLVHANSFAEVAGVFE
jgi:senataxin